jgi:tetratricopeptide (TPR) repeat protein
MRIADLSAARDYYEKALPICRKIEARMGEASTLNALGNLSMRTDDLSAARNYYKQALPICRDIEDRLGEANTLKALGNLSICTDDLSIARDYYEQALPIYRKIEDRRGEANTLQGLALILSAQDRLLGIRAYRLLMNKFSAIGDQMGIGSALGYEARNWAALEKYGAAVFTAEEAYVLHKEIEERHALTLDLSTSMDIFISANFTLGFLAAIRVHLDISREIDIPGLVDLEARWENIASKIKEDRNAPEALIKILADLESSPMKAEELRKAFTHEYINEHFTGEEKDLYENTKPLTDKELDVIFKK